MRCCSIVLLFLNSCHSWVVQMFGILSRDGAVSMMMGLFCLSWELVYGLVTCVGTYDDLDAENDGMVSDGVTALFFSGRKETELGDVDGPNLMS